MENFLYAGNDFQGRTCGHHQKPDRLLNVALGNSLEHGTEQRGLSRKLFTVSKVSAWANTSTSSSSTPTSSAVSSTSRATDGPS